MIPALAALALLAGAPQQSDIAGLYVASQMEMAGAIELQPGGRFRYRLDYGAVSESAEGDWTLDGSIVRLTSNPMPKAPDFEVVNDELAPGGALIILLETPYQGWNGPIEGFVIPRDGHEPYDLDLDDEGRSAFDSAAVKSIIPAIPVYGGIGTPIPISPGSGHHLLLRFKANDLGKAAFRAEPLAIDGASLVMNRYDRQILFRREEQ